MQCFGKCASLCAITIAPSKPACHVELSRILLLTFLRFSVLTAAETTGLPLHKVNSTSSGLISNQAALNLSLL